MSLLRKLNNTLENQLSILSSSDLQGDELDEELKRNRAITDVSKQIVETHKMALEAQKLNLEYGGRVNGLQNFIEVTDYVVDAGTKGLAKK